jgi:hypothetical protein
VSNQEANAVPEKENLKPGEGRDQKPNNQRSEKASNRRSIARRALLLAVVFLVGFLIFGVIAIQVWEYSNSFGFCTNVCHAVHPEEPAAFSDSYHASVKCTECHMGRTGTIRGIILKAGHFRHLPEVLFKNYTRPLKSETMRPANESCEKCHYPPAFHGDRVMVVQHYESDETNTEQDTYLILKTGGGQRSQGLGFGIHWHIENPISYIATDDQKQQIRWVQATLPDGRIVEYSDVTNPLTADEIATLPKKTMDCVDCHNRAGHPFSSPEKLVDDAITQGRLSKDLPYLKEEMVSVLSADYPDQAAAQRAVDQVEEQYRAKYPQAADKYVAEVKQAAAVAQDLLGRLVFAQAGVTWRSFPDNIGHNDFPGCFRCHDGKHLAADGASIRLHCNICHGVPEIAAADGRAPQLPVTTVQEPATHLGTNFMNEHRFLASQEVCGTCHGEITFGSDNSNFCANSACHGRSWPDVNLNAAFPHPIELTGKHAQVWCNDCHEGVAKPEYKCANCHQPPMQPHFGDQCEECHTTAGFDQAILTNFQHPVPLEGKHAGLQCTACHEAGKTLEYKCASCHQPPNQPHFGTNCEQCHTPAGFEQATLPPELHPIPLIGAHARATCEVCHAEGQRIPEYVCSNCHRPPEGHFTQPCDQCHTPEGWVQSAQAKTNAPAIPHSLEGRGNCLVCHDPAGNVKPAPASHKDYTNEQCVLCHKAVP